PNGGKALTRFSSCDLVSFVVQELPTTKDTKGTKELQRLSPSTYTDLFFTFQYTVYRLLMIWYSGTRLIGCDWPTALKFSGCLLSTSTHAVGRFASATMSGVLYSSLAFGS